MSGSNAFDRQLEREIEALAGPEPRVDVREIVKRATATRRRPVLGGWFGSVPAAATAGALVVALVLTIGFLWSDRSVVVAPAATPTAEPSPTSLDETAPVALAEAPVAGTWALPEPLACGPRLPLSDEIWIQAIEVCDGLRFDVPDDQRLSGSGYLRHETWHEGTAPELWRLSNSGGTWESQRYQDHDRFVFRGGGGYDGLIAVVTLADDGALSGFVRTAQPREDDQ
jgi:hypothetical protein